MSDLLDASFAGEWGKAEGSALTPVFRTANFNEDGTLDYANPVMRCITEKKVHEKKLRRGDIILEKSGGTPNRPVGILAYFDSDDLALCSNFNQVLRFDARIIVPRYAFYQLRWLKDRNAFDRYIHKTTGLQNLEMKRFGELELLVPELSTQLHITDTLDKVLGAQHQLDAQLAKLDSLVKSRFVEMFDGAPWQVVRASDVMTSFRNGVSPSKDADIHERVLTLSAITQGHFDETAWKDGTFKELPASDKRVSDSDFYICRGNGNKQLVGVGEFADDNHPELVFPDTMIAGTINKNLVRKPFLTQVWKHPSVRRQIEAKARTTNGTLKINQKVVSEIRFPLPPLEVQDEFASFIERVDKLRFEQLVALKKRGSQHLIAGESSLRVQQDITRWPPRHDL